MEENYCFLCQEPKNVVGHITELCPNAKCRKCGQKGHTLKNCPDLNIKTDERSRKLDQDPWKTSMQNSISSQVKNDAITGDFFEEWNEITPQTHI